MSNYSFTFIDWLISPRTGYQLHRAGVGSLYAFSLSSLSVAFVISTFRKKNNFGRMISILFYIFIVYFYGSKGLILSYFIYGLSILWFFNYKNLTYFILFGGLSVFTLLIYNLFSTKGEMDFMTIFSYFDYYVNSAMYYKSYFEGGIKLFYGKIFLTDFWSFIPRGLYPEKPYVYGFLHVNEYFFSGAAERTHTPAFGGPLVSFADFGVIGVIVSSLFDFTYLLSLYALNCIFRYTNINNFRYKTSYIFIFILCFAPGFLSFIPSVVAVAVSLFFYSVMIFFAKVTYKDRST